MKIIALLQDKNRMLSHFLDLSVEMRARLEVAKEQDERLDLIDEFTDEREKVFRLMQIADREIELERSKLDAQTQATLKSHPSFKSVAQKTVELLKEIQLTDQSLFLYIQKVGFDVRAQILRSLKEKEAMSKFKSPNPSQTGEELDQTV